MSLTVDIPKEYGYVVLTTTATMALSLWHASWTGGFRKRAKIPHPNSYASDKQQESDPAAYAFNCAQRAHANYVENHGMIMASLLISGLKYPLTATAMGGIWMVGRILYAVGYAKTPIGKYGSGRRQGLFFWMPQFGLVALTGWTGLQALLF
ncbi:MAG: hypothetical protein M1817_001309 [Caeruleum heppii]|nr:MAG: hypothetical protein M1817_001309 [Caeruleum heppii]